MLNPLLLPSWKISENQWFFCPPGAVSPRLGHWTSPFPPPPPPFPRHFDSFPPPGRSAFLASPRSSFKSLFSARSPAMSRHMSSTGRSCSAEVHLRSISLLPQRDLFNGFYKWGTSNHPMLLIFSIIHLGAHVWKPPLVGEILWNPGPPSGPPSARLCLLHPQCGKFSLQLLCITCRSCGCGNFLELLL